MNLDAINATFELLAIVAIANHCKAIAKAKSSAGVSQLSIAFFFVWGAWNMAYYPSLGQSLSAFAGVGVCIANLVHVALAVRYRKPGPSRD